MWTKVFFHPLKCYRNEDLENYRKTNLDEELEKFNFHNYQVKVG
jgi:hypothetical protein